MLLGSYVPAASLWEDKAIPRVRYDRSSRVLSAASAVTRGEPVPATNTFLALPSTLRQQATWTYDLAMCQLEAGMPDKAAESFTTALTLMPDLVVRPIAAYYLEKLGKPVPPRSKPGLGTAAPTSTPVEPPPKTGASPAESSKNEHKDPAKG